LAFFFFFNVYLNGPRDSKLIGQLRVASPSLRLSFLPPRPRGRDIVASANVRGRVGDFGLKVSLSL
jgi:hypothetical protein